MRLLFWALWIAVLAMWAIALTGCRKPAVGVGLGSISSSVNLDAPGEEVLSDGIVTCELRRDQFGHVYEKSNIPLEKCFSIWMKDNAGQDHYEEWFHKQYGDPLTQEGRKQAQTHLLGRT